MLVAGLLIPYRIVPAPADYTPKFLDLNSDGRQDAVLTVTNVDIPVLWLDDDGNMKNGDREGDLVNDCILIDRDKDGIYDLIVKHADLDNDGKADIQLICDYPDGFTSDKFTNGGHYMWVLDEDHDGVFNYINWNTLKLECWQKNNISDFYTDYSGNTSFIKAHRNTFFFDDLRLSWENPFIFYDVDNDGLSEMAVRATDWTKWSPESSAAGFARTQYHGETNWISIAWDLDNDNHEGSDFDFDMTVVYLADDHGTGVPTGFNYMDQVHPLRNMRGLPEADVFFPDPRIRQLTELIYPDRKTILPLTFAGRWDSVKFTFDEDDDCGRWERVELYDDKDPFVIGINKGGIDNHFQSDVSGDRGEFDNDNSGGGNLYVSRFDGRIHLYGAERGHWRIDQNTQYYQGWNRSWQGTSPRRWATVSYEDADGNGFFDTIKYDIDGDSKYETTVSLKDLGIDDTCDIITLKEMNYKKMSKLFARVSSGIWNNAMLACKAAEACGVETAWYSKMLSHRSRFFRYREGYWIQYYIYQDLLYKFTVQNDKAMADALTVAYYSGDWKSFLKTIR